MRIVFIGNHSVDYSSETHHCKSLESLGHEVVKLQEGQADSDRILSEGLRSDLVVFVHTHGWVTPGMPIDKIFNFLRDAGKPVITYHLDLWLGLERQKDLDNDPFYKSLDYFFATDKLMCDWFNQNTNVKGRFLPAGVFDQECYIHQDYDKKNFDYDVIFVGSKGYHPEYPYRPQLIDFLRETYGPRFLHIGGDGDTGTIRGDRLNRMYARSKIAVGDSLNINFSYPYYTSDRLFESTGRGGFTIYPDIVGLNEYFNPNEVVFYEHGNLYDLKSKIDQFLLDNHYREQIRINGHERTKREHTYKHRWQTILNEVFPNE